MVNNSGTAEPTLVCCEPTKTDKNRQKPTTSSINSGTATAVPGVPGVSCLFKGNILKSVQSFAYTKFSVC